jgi:hypothetical protein
MTAVFGIAPFFSREGRSAMNKLISYYHGKGFPSI